VQVSGSAGVAPTGNVLIRTKGNGFEDERFVGLDSVSTNTSQARYAFGLPRGSYVSVSATAEVTIQGAVWWLWMLSVACWVPSGAAGLKRGS
jgi:hypothetical protein